MVALLLPAAPAVAEPVLPGPIPAQVVEVIDGDTLAVDAWIWLGQHVTTRVRLAGIDTPEMRARCDGERSMAEAARDYLARLVASGAVTLSDVHYGTYAGRVVARVLVDDRDAGADLLASGLAVDYTGRGPRHDWCAALTGN